MNIIAVDLSVVRPLILAHHGYGTVGKVSTYAFAVLEGGWEGEGGTPIPPRIVAAYVWNPPPHGAALAVCSRAPWGVLALTRMAAVPKSERALKHVSKPLMLQTKRLIDRGRWPVLVTFSDASQGHTGYVYQCTGWTKDGERTVKVFVDEHGGRRSRYADGVTDTQRFARAGTAVITRWLNRACFPGFEDIHMANAGWRREVVPGKFWRSGSPVHRVVRV